MNLTTTCKEIKAIFKYWPVWLMLATQDIKLRYRRSSIGPFWITISMGVTVYTMGFLYGHLFGLNLDYYFPFLASGLIGWSFISTLILESSNAFIEAEGYIRNQESFMSLFIMRLICRNLIIFSHNLLVFIPIVFLFHVEVSLKTLLLIPGIFIISVNVMLWGNLLAIIGTRYRDFAQIVGSLVQVIFFLTPIMWTPTSLQEKFRWTIIYNPFAQFLNLIRAPLLNKTIEIQSVEMITFITISGLFLYSYFLTKYKHRIVFWL